MSPTWLSSRVRHVVICKSVVGVATSGFISSLGKMRQLAQADIRGHSDSHTHTYTHTHTHAYTCRHHSELIFPSEVTQTTKSEAMQVWNVSPTHKVKLKVVPLIN
jgi:hypothetical protein